MRKKKAQNDNVIFNDRIVNYVDSFFEGIHYSKETQIIKNNIISKISNDYDDFCRNDKRNAFKKIVKKYDSLEKMLESVQFTALSGRRSVLERPLSGENGRPFLVNTPDIIGY